MVDGLQMTLRGRTSHEGVWTTVVENPMARVKGFILSVSPQSIRGLARIREDVDFNYVTISVRLARVLC